LGGTAPPGMFGSFSAIKFLANLNLPRQGVKLLIKFPRRKTPTSQSSQMTKLAL
jgi:hypothetical protein